MERMAVDAIAEKFGFRPTGFRRFSDQCAKQFKSRFTTWNLSVAPVELGLVSGEIWVEHHFYEVGHGKNESDRLGALGKAAYTRAMTGRGSSETPTSMEEIAGLIRSCLPGKGGDDFLEVVVVPPLERPGEHGQIPVEGIQQLHSLTRLPDGTILGRRLSCQECIALQVRGCDDVML